jgi:hypothetical protein
MRSKVAAEAAQQEESRLVRPEKGTSAEALGLIFAPIVERGEGFRHGAIGAPGFGKTYGLRRVIDAAIEQDLVDLVLTHDVKGAKAEFDGVECKTVSIEALKDPRLEQGRHAIFRGDLRNDVTVECEEVAQLGKRLVQKEELRVLLNVGELRDALTDGGRSWKSPGTLWFSAQARAIQGSLAWTVQQPKRAPDEIFDQSTTIAFHHLDQRSANYLGGTLLLDELMVEVISKLENGEFVLWQQGIEWNRRVYRF